MLADHLGANGVAHAPRVCSERFFGVSAPISAESVQDNQPTVAQMSRKQLGPNNLRSEISFIQVLLGVCVLVGMTVTTESRAHAAPPLVKGEHPYDPDWAVVYLTLTTKCNGCHREGGKPTDLTSYEAVMAAKTRKGQRLVVPGKPEESLLYHQVVWDVTEKDEDLPLEPLMPPEFDEWLTGQQLAAMKRWIKNGALEYKLPNTCSPKKATVLDFPSAKSCKACHPRQYQQWSRSMHAYAQHSPVVEAFNQTLQERTGGSIGTFCVRCHTPIGIALGEKATERNVHRSRIAMEGITCAVCHRIKRPYYKANMRMAIQPGKLIDACLYGPFDDPVADGMKAHVAKGLPHFRSAAFCGTCHDVTNPEGVRLEEAFSEWQNSPAAKQGVTCQHCHMGPVQGVPYRVDQRPMGRAAEVPGVDPKHLPIRHLSDHTFAGPDYSMLPDTEFPHKLDWMYEVDYRDTSKLTSYQKESLTDLRKRNRLQLMIADKKRYELLSNAAELEVKAPRFARAGRKTEIRVDVRSKFAGHNFPTGFTSERQAWVEVLVSDPYGQVVFRSGDLDHNRDLRDAHSHEVEAGTLAYDRHLLNFQSKFVVLTNKGTERSVVIPVNRHLRPLTFLRPSTVTSATMGRHFAFRMGKSSLPANATMGKSYPVRIPNTCGEYNVRVRLNYRHLPPNLFDKLGVAHLKKLLQVVVIDEYQTSINVTE
ncbi:MAG: hypothetical protein CMJ78_16920 [Planctomycetaceae bacterium]|nr:hypothetical protein [Planctomycetaceae bacterium]